METGTGTEAGTATGWERGRELEWRGNGDESFGIRHIRTEAEYKARHRYYARGIMFVDSKRGWERGRRENSCAVWRMASSKLNLYEGLFRDLW